MLKEICGNFFPGLYKIVRSREYNERYIFWLLSTSESAVCPVCGSKSSRAHGYQKRAARDLPILGKGVTLLIIQKKYFCDNTECETDIFTEQNELICQYSQFTERCREYMLKVTTLVSSEAAAKILAYQGIRVSGDTLLNMLKDAGREYKGTVGKKIGVDDWAYRRGQKYGTLICDLETHEIIDILEDRDSETFEKWLQGYPGIEIVTRDRASSYSSALNKVLPNAVQIADRFHITQNLLTALNDTMKAFIPEVIEVPNRQCADRTGETAELEKSEGIPVVKKTRK